MKKFIAILFIAMAVMTIACKKAVEEVKSDDAPKAEEVKK